MKKLYSLILITVFLMLSLGGISQPPPPPGNPSNLSGTANAPVGAPIGNGTLILLLLAAAYGGRKVYVLHSQPEVQ